VILLALALSCSGSEQQAVAPPSRFDAVMAKPSTGPPDTSEFCEGATGSGKPLSFAWPKLDAAVPRASPGWTWVNVWATWCAPCVEEMPRLQKWQKRLTADAGPGVLRFLSVDATAKAVTAFAGHYPDIQTGVRIKEFSDLAGWLPTIGLDAGAVLPIHVFLDADQRIRCVREGAVNSGDYEVVRQVLRDMG
jgi:thiol-disulfide isomerase/thioredoxin